MKFLRTIYTLLVVLFGSFLTFAQPPGGTPPNPGGGGGGVGPGEQAVPIDGYLIILFIAAVFFILNFTKNYMNVRFLS